MTNRTGPIVQIPTLIAGERVVVSGRQLALARGTAADIDVPCVHVWTIGNDNTRRVELFTDTVAVHQARTVAADGRSR